MKNRVLRIVIIVSLCMITFANIYAESDFWGSATNWFAKSSKDTDIAEIDGVNTVLDSFLSMINILGTTTIVSVTIILGIKFIISGPEGKASAKDGLVTLVVACVFFFGWTSLKNILYPDNKFILFSDSDSNIEAPVGRAFAYVKFFGNIFAFIGIVVVGIKYIFASAAGKADFKSQSPQLMIGLIMTFATVNFLSLISDAINQALQ